jgi:hypothetical protein
MPKKKRGAWWNKNAQMILIFLPGMSVLIEQSIQHADGGELSC